jgi:hypothetical protein
MPHIAHIASLWTLDGHPSPAAEWPLERKIKAIAAAGFDGLTAVLTPEHRRLAEKYELRHLLGHIRARKPAEFARLIRAQKEGGAMHINVQLGDHDTPPAVATKQWIQLERAAEEIDGVVVSLEVHRGMCTETVEKTYEIADRYHRATGELIRMNFDFSHIASVKHLNPDNYISRLLERPELVQHSEQVHFRPFNGHHCQVPVTFKGALSPEVKSYLRFVEAFMRVWKKGRANKEKTMFACPELGPHAADGSGYNISGLPPAWPDAVVLRHELGRVWARA